jgi:tRNA (guanine37-N1)-methyltransferase
MKGSAGVTEWVVLSIFPGLFPGPLGEGVVGKALEKGLLRLEVRDLRDWAEPPHYQVDDTPFGGGAGMVFKPEPLFRAIEELKRDAPETRVVLLDPAGRRFDQALAQEMASWTRTLFVCGRYEGIDNRVREHLVDEEISIGDYVLAGGELPAMVVMESVARCVPGVVGDAESVTNDSFQDDRLDHPHYTRPAEYEGMAVPEILLSGHHARIEAWRRERSQELTRKRRPDLLDKEKNAADDETPRKRGQ